MDTRYNCPMQQIPDNHQGPVFNRKRILVPATPKIYLGNEDAVSPGHPARLLVTPDLLCLPSNEASALCHTLHNHTNPQGTLVRHVGFFLGMSQCPQALFRVPGTTLGDTQPAGLDDPMLGTLRCSAAWTSSVEDNKTISTGSRGQGHTVSGMNLAWHMQSMYAGLSPGYICGEFETSFTGEETGGSLLRRHRDES